MGVPNIYKIFDINKLSIMTLLDNPVISTVTTKHFCMKPEIRDKERKCDQIEIVARNTFRFLYKHGSSYYQKMTEIKNAIGVCLEHDIPGTVSRFQKDFNCIIPEEIKSAPETYNIPLLNMDLETLDAALNHIKNNYKKDKDLKVEKEKLFKVEKQKQKEEEDGIKDVIKEVHIKNLEPFNIMKEVHSFEDPVNELLEEEPDSDQLYLELFGYLDNLYDRSKRKFSFMLGRYDSKFNSTCSEDFIFRDIGAYFKNYSAEDLQKVVNYFKRESEHVK
jgi:hypothetical protein